MNEDYLLSVIIPVYNAEKYIDRCIQSVCGQTYTNLEIILIDDGSIDKSGIICDDYSVRDKRIKVFHVKNGGQASARNIGLSHASGEYITFVDNDDWIDNNMYEKLIGLAKKYDCSVTGCGTLKEYSDGSTLDEYTERKSGIIPGRQCIIDILYQNKTSWGAMWNKIYKRELWKGLIFPNGMQLEDYVVITKIFNSVDSVYFYNEPMYHYSIRNDSQSKKPFSEQKISIIESAESIRNYILNHSNDNELNTAANYFVFFILIIVLWDCYKSNYPNKKRIIASYRKKTYIELKKSLFKTKKHRKMLNMIAKFCVMNIAS